MKIALLVLALVAGCTKENAAFCCIDPADCAAKGVEDTRLCTDGLACVENQCVASMCAMTGCAAEAPVCEVATDTCVGCVDSMDCSRFPASDVCNASGACVECVANTDCDAAAKPICDGAACRGCAVDAECASGACDDDGACVPEANVVYLSPTGSDVAPCSKAASCVELSFALQQATTARRHIVFAPGTYTQGNLSGLTIGPSSTAASRIFLHGGGATWTGGSSDGGLGIGVPTTIRDLTLVASSDPPGTLISVHAPAAFEGVTVRGRSAIYVASQLTARRLTIHASQVGITNAGVLTLDQANIVGGEVGIESTAGSVAITNVLVSGASVTGVSFSNTSGTLSFSTIAGAGLGTTTGIPGLRCGFAGITVQSTIVWTPTPPTDRTVVDGSCNFVSSIIGPIGAVGAMNTNPSFVDPQNGDYHLGGASPARDLVNDGPAVDFEGDPRPRGVRFDIGADEAP